MKYEYSQTILFERNTFEIIADIKSEHNVFTVINFKDDAKNHEFYDICKSWDLFGSNLVLEVDGLHYSGAQMATDAYEYAKFMSLVISYLEKDFKYKEGKK